MLNLTINLNAKLQPLHRHDLEDALQEALKKLDFEAEVTGGGTLNITRTKWRNSILCIEIQLAEDSDENIEAIMGVMEAMLTPIGSQIIIYPKNKNTEVRKIPFGVQQGLGLYLNGKDLDEAIYKDCDVNFVYQEIERLLGDFKTGHIASYWEGEETSLYLYGESFDEMHNRIKPLLKEYPLCQKCRVIRIA